MPPGHTVTYTWAVPEQAGPQPGATVSSRMWLYRSNVDPAAHDNAGLTGPVIVAGRGQAGPGGRARDVDRDVVRAGRGGAEWALGEEAERCLEGTGSWKAERREGNGT